MLFRWAIPERTIDQRSLPTIPAEIYLAILERLAPPGEKLSSEQMKTLTRFAGACKLFCYIALPRIYERVAFVGHVYYRHDDLSWREASWHRRIASREDLALWAAKCVKVCDFCGCNDSWSVGVFADRYTSILKHTINIRRLTFNMCLIENEHWRAMMALGALEELCIYRCEFAEVPQPTQTSHPVKISVPFVEFYQGDDVDASVAAEALDLGRLRSLKTDIGFAGLLNWPQDCILEKLHVSGIDYSSPEHQAILKPILRQTGQRVTELKLTFWERIFLPDFESHLRDTLPENSQNLRSLTLVVDGMTRDSIEARKMSSFICRYVGFSPTMEKLAIKYFSLFPSPRRRPQPPSPDHVQDVTLSTILPAFPKINYVEIYGTTLRLEGCSWVKFRAV